MSVDWWQDDGDVRLAQGDAEAVLRELPAASVQCVVTSPPYLGLRDYGTGAWTGGKPDCDHSAARRKGRYDYPLNPGLGPTGVQTQASNAASGEARYADSCPCGAQRVDQQVGLEPTPGAYVERLVGVFRQVRRVLRDDGTAWLNLGDSYAASRGYQVPDGKFKDVGNNGSASIPAGLKAKDLIGLPWRVAFALQADGWYLRSDIIWSKPNPMPESVSDRPTTAHEHVFLLAKRATYYYDADAIREPHAEATDPRPLGTRGEQGWAAAHIGSPQRDNNGGVGAHAAGRNRRSVWEIPTEPFPEAHFATFPQALVEPCVKAGTSEHGACSACGAPWRRVVEGRSLERHELSPTDARYRPARYEGKYDLLHGGNNGMRYHTSETRGWQASCRCDAPVRPCLVLDPFCGSGTTCLVARRLGRHAVGIDLSADYLRIAARRLQQLSLLTGTPA